MKLHPVGRLRMAAFALLAATVLAVGRGASTRAQVPSGPVRLSGHTLGALNKAMKLSEASAAATAADTAASSSVAGSAPLTLTLVLNRSDQAGFDAYFEALQDPASPHYRQ